MELTKAKYKQTEVGLIPEDWDILELGEIGFFKNGINKSKEDFGFGFPFVNLMDVFGKPKIYGNEMFDLINSSEHERNLYNLKTGDVLFIRSSVKPSGVGLTSIVSKDLDKTVFSGFLIRFRDNGRLYNEYKKHCFYYEKFRNELIASSSVSANTNINQEALKKLKLIVPTLTEQKAIATALSDVDELIANLDKLIVKKKAIKQGAMQQLLTPNDTWINTSLIELAENKKNQFDDGDWIESEYIISQGVRLIQTGNIGIGVFKDKGNKKYISEESFIKLNCKEVLEGDLLICRLAEPAGRACVMPNIGEDKVVTSVDVSIFRGDERIVNRRFLSHFFTTNQWFNQVIERVGGTTHKRISRGALGQIEFFIPKIEEQNKIAQILSDMDVEIDVLEAKKAKHQDIKQGMMQELLTGKTRLV
jgi:type I restriction enzyme, S subunit